MKSASISDIKKEIEVLDPDQLVKLCLRLAKHKKENKELLSYLIFDSHDTTSFIKLICEEVDEQFKLINRTNLYLVKKSLRKILRFTNKYIKFNADKETEVILLMYFCSKLKKSGIPFQSATVLNNLYTNQLKKIKSTLEALHEDIQADYQMEVEKLEI